MLVNTNLSKSMLLLLFTIILSSNLEAQIWSLDQCVDSAMVNNKKLQMSKNESQIIAGKENEIKANLLPKITANGDYKYYTDLPTQLMPLSVFGGPEGQFKEAQFGVPHNITANLQLSMPLYSPELYGGLEVIKIASQVSELQHQKTEEQIYFDIVNMYYNAQIIKSQMTFLESNLVNSRKLLNNVQLLHQELLAQKTDVDKVALQVMQIETNKLMLESKYLQVINGLKLLMGISQTESVEVSFEIIKEEEIQYNNEKSIDSKLIEAKYNLLSSELSTLEKTRYLPSAFLYGSYGTLGYGYNEDPNSFLNFYTMGFVGAKVTYPLFNGTVTNQKINQKKLELINTDLQSSLIEDQNITLIKHAKLQRNIAQATIKSSELEIELAKIIYAQTVLQLKSDLASLTDVLLADNALRSAEQNYLNSLVDYLKADLELKKITGNLK